MDQIPTELHRRGFLRDGSIVLGALTLGVGPTLARAAVQDRAATVEALSAKAVAFLKSRQEEGGGWSSERKEPGITALVITGLLKSKLVTPTDPVIEKGLKYLDQFARKEGGFDGSHSIYTTSIGLLAYKEANVGGRYDAVISAGQKYLKEMQWDESEGKGPADTVYGGAGYGGSAKTRPDLSNTVFMVEALRDTGLPANDPAVQKALAFVSRCQNLKSEFNDQPWADKVNDGGFVYTAANGGTSVAGKDEASGGLRSYGSMTYAGYKSLIFAGLTRDDPRVKAALDYLAKHYTVDENPGLGDRGLYYYYQAMAKALNSMGEPTFTDGKGTPHDWRTDIVNALARRQTAEGSWVNSTDGFMEGDANLVTAYSLIALSHARAPR